MSARTLEGKVALVTGASRGAGQGIAHALGQHGATVYVTGRSQQEGDAPLPGTIFETAEQVTAAGGTGIAVACDHADDEDVEKLFRQIADEQDGKLNLLVNNATFLHDQLIEKGPFWEKPLDMVNVLDVGLRSAYVASWYAARLMAPRDDGLIAFTSSFGASCYMHGPSYGAQKVGVDKFAMDMSVDFRGINVACVSIWMGMLRTARTRRAMQNAGAQYEGFWEIAETPEFTGHVLAALYADPDRAAKSGQVHIGAELALAYGIDDEGRQPPSHREMLGGPHAAHPAIVE